MSPHDLFNDGRLGEALAEQRRVVDRMPADPAARLFLCELLLFAGEAEEARRQLESIPADSADWREFVAEYQGLLEAAHKREAVLAGGSPAFFTDPPEHARARLEAIHRLAGGRLDEASVRLDKADQVTPHVLGHVDGREFDGLRDGDDRFASVLEVFAGDEYVWVPFEDVRRLRLAPVESPRDQLFRPATLRLRDNSEHGVYLPTLYPGSGGHPEEAVRAGRETDWLSCGEGFIRGAGLRVFHFGDDEELTPWELTQLDVRGG